MISIDPSEILSCETEPIRYPGSIQPHGALLVLNSEGIIEAASESCDALLGYSANYLLNQPFELIFGFSMAELFTSYTSQDYLQALQHLSFNGRELTFRSFLNSNDQLLLDFENRCSLRVSNDLLYQYRENIKVLRQLNDFASIIQEATKLIRHMTGFDRVMIYQFDEVWNGKVIAEANIDTVESYLGFNFPASDIPKQARELFKLCSVRYIPEVLYDPSMIIGSLDRRSIDLGLSNLRSVSPIHIEYLNNMKVRSSLVGALIVEDQLWGLVSCHHTTQAKYFSPEERDIFGWLFDDLASLIQETLIRELREREYNLTLRRQRLINLVREVDIKTLIQQDCHTDLLEVVAADGFALLIGDSLQTTGSTPNVGQIFEIQQRYRDQDCDNLFASCTLDADLGLTATNDDVAGVLIISVRKHPSITMMWFRKELYYSIQWGGNPQYAHVVDISGRISPRKSFAQFVQNVSGQSLPWLPEEINSAKELGALIDIELLRKEQAFAETIINSSPDNIAVLDANGVITLVNASWNRFASENNIPLIASKSIGTNYLDICATALGLPKSEAALSARLGIEAVLNKAQDYFALEYPCESAKELRWFKMHVYPMLAPCEGVVIVHQNITSGKLAELRLEQEQNYLRELVDILVLSEEKFSKVFNFSPIGIAISRMSDGKFIDINDAFLQIYGFAREDVLGHTSTELKLWENPDDRKIVMDKLQQQGIVKNEEVGFRRKSGVRGTLLISLHTIHFSDEACILAAITDITERKWIESKLTEGWQLKQFASYLQTEIERERTKIARDIHDDLGSRLTSIKLAIRQCPTQYSFDEQICPFLTEINDAIQSVKIIATNLRPSILDTLGLRDAIDWLVDDFGSRTNIHCIKALPDEIPIEDSLRATAVFRILQESLTNITKHTTATEVFIHLELEQGNILMTIEDNGCGIQEKDMNRVNAFGLLGMRERADYLGGILTINNLPEGGTQIGLTIPLNTSELVGD